MFEPTENDVDESLLQSIDMFERSRIGEVAAVQPRTPRKILLVLDGSSQDDMGKALAGGLARRFNCPLDVCDAREGDATSDLAQRVATSLGATSLARRTGESYEQILAATQETQADLVVVPSPYGRDLESVGTDSTGTVIDVLLARSPVPVLVVRNTYPLGEPPFEWVLFALMGENEAVPAASSWAMGLTAADGRLELKLILDEEVFENVRELMRSMVPGTEVTAEQLTDAMQRSHLRLHRAFQLSSKDQGFRYRLDVCREGDAALSELTGGARHPLLVLALDRANHASRGHVHDRIRQSPHSVLVIATKS